MYYLTLTILRFLCILLTHVSHEIPDNYFNITYFYPRLLSITPVIKCPFSIEFDAINGKILSNFFFHFSDMSRHKSSLIGNSQIKAEAHKKAVLGKTWRRSEEDHPS